MRSVGGYVESEEVDCSDVVENYVLVKCFVRSMFLLLRNDLHFIQHSYWSYHGGFGNFSYSNSFNTS